MGLGAEGFDGFAEECEAFAADLQQAADDLPDEMEEGVRNTAERMQETMQERAPSDSGTLKDSITHEQVEETRHDVEWHLGPEADYAHYVEYGTGIHGPTGEKYTILPKGVSEEDFAQAQAKASEKAQQMREAGANGDPAREAAMQVMQEFAKENGALDIGEGDPVFKVRHPGSEAQPYFHPTVNDAILEGWLEAELSKATDDAFAAIDRNGV